MNFLRTRDLKANNMLKMTAAPQGFDGNKS